MRDGIGNVLVDDCLSLSSTSRSSYNLLLGDHFPSSSGDALLLGPPASGLLCDELSLLVCSLLFRGSKVLVLLFASMLAP